MTRDLLRRTAAEVWRRAIDVLGEVDRGDIRAAVEAALPVTVVGVERLTPDDAAAWLRRRGITSDLSGRESMRGCLLAQRGKAWLFVRAEDDAVEQRFTIAHEAAHFLLHHERQRTTTPTDVLDGDRPATSVERLDGVLLGRPTRPHVHVYGSDDETTAENDADALALELLAPAVERRRFDDPVDAAEAFSVSVRVMQAAMRRPQVDPLVEWAQDVLRGGVR